ncbi:MAG TPA: hypothetical protein PL009_00985 [Flavipsychrobacter sp.]|nr:hypothetical protein [Flavipsychrobacter sp.]
MQNGLLHLHNFMRWLVLLFALLALIRSMSGISGKREFTKTDKKMALFMMICADIQLLLGLSLFYLRGWFDVLKSGALNMADTYQRFWAIEHLAGMLIALILIHVAYSATKSDISDGKRFKRIFWCTLIALIVIFVTIPWPFRELIGRPWFPGMSVGS